MNLEAEDVFILELCSPQAFSFPVQVRNKDTFLCEYSLLGKRGRMGNFFKRFFFLPETCQ